MEDNNNSYTQKQTTKVKMVKNFKLETPNCNNKKEKNFDRNYLYLADTNSKMNCYRSSFKRTTAGVYCSSLLFTASEVHSVFVVNQQGHLLRAHHTLEWLPLSRLWPLHRPGSFKAHRVCIVRVFWHIAVYCLPFRRS